MVKWIIVAILLLPVAEIATFVAVGAIIGFGWAFTLMLATTIAGFMVLRRAGRGQLASFQASVAKSGIAGVEVSAGSFLPVLAGILLFLPGFLTDLAGGVLLLGPVQRACTAALQRTVTGRTRSGGRPVIDLAPDEWKQLPDRDAPKSSNTPGLT